ncbi:TetR family transcriptional regulator [Nocardioides zeae]|uniref:TetR family transcriptional regulator n=1 Tax=Nocardioides imazamoxiresistens TaxID=3231893 RepID=A0ABU3PVS8_9ACTN|nr:TetR family transcriptional regulator [Nocardioides zeae]MDT9593311.1 TetR family transcriptional regulator [Nocardioides zeae]
MPPPPRRTAKAEATRATIVAAARRLFREGGYDATTMRAVADAAGVSLGNAYYYFASKEHLVQGFYDQLSAEHLEAVTIVLAEEPAFSARLAGVLERWVDVAAPYHDFATTFFRNAADPRSPLSPFSPESAAAREATVAIHREVLAGADLRVPPALREDLPELLWLLQMGVVLFWVYDSSPDQARTRTLIHGVVPVVDRLIRLTRLPVARGIAGDVVALVRSVRAG